MISFHRLCENMDLVKIRSISPQNNKAVEIVRAGLNIDNDFWDKFIQVIGNSDGVADLLDVPKEKIIGWSSKIRKIIDQINNHDDETAKEEKSKMMPTGSLSIADPSGSTDTATPDLRPTP